MRAQGLRVGVSSLVMLTFALSAHHVGGGGFISPNSLMIESLLFFTAMLAMRKQYFQGPSLAALIVVAQLGSHFILGTGSIGSDTPRMLFSHMSFGFLSYFLIKKLELFWHEFAEFLSGFFLPQTVVKWSFISQKKSWIIPAWLRTFSFYFNQAHGLRAPPALSLSI